MNNDILFKVLQLDSLIGILHWSERAIIHQILNGKTLNITRKIVKTYEWIDKENWQPPKMEYKDDRLQYFYEPHGENWQPKEDFLLWFPELKDELNKLKI